MNDVAEEILPYNVSNFVITPSNIKQLFGKLNIDVDIININWYIKAMTHESYTIAENPNIISNNTEALDLFVKSNERLEFLGDSIIKAIVTEYLFDRYPDQDEGFMTYLKTKIEDRESLAKYARRIGLGQYLIISQQIEDNNGRESSKLLEDCFESFIGALKKDLGFDICNTFLRKILETEIDYSDLIYKDTNYKNQLIKFYHKNKLSDPIYVLLKIEGELPKQYFTIGVKDTNDKILEYSISRNMSKKKTEQICAMKILYKHNQISKDQMIDESK